MRKEKSFTLLNCKEDNWHLLIVTQIDINGKFATGGTFQFYEEEEKSKSSMKSYRKHIVKRRKHAKEMY